MIHEYEHSMADPKLFKTFGDKYEFMQDGMKFEMMAAFGETDNQILIHVPAKSLLLPGGIKYSLCFCLNMPMFTLKNFEAQTK